MLIDLVSEINLMHQVLVMRQLEIVLGYNGVNNNSNARSPKIESAVAESSPYKPNGGNLKEGGNSASAVSKD